MKHLIFTCLFNLVLVSLTYAQNKQYPWSQYYPEYKTQPAPQPGSSQTGTYYSGTTYGGNAHNSTTITTPSGAIYRSATTTPSGTQSYYAPTGGSNYNAASGTTTYSSAYNYYEPPVPVIPFETQQLGFTRVWQAKYKREAALQQEFAQKGLNYPPAGMFIRIFKRDQVLEVWVDDTGSGVYEKFKDYRICAASGVLGPKRMEGDKQVPEGFYRVDDFNPRSSFHLSLGINYPNVSDRLLGVRSKLGGDIYIHGGCISIGCVAIDNNKIEEVYWLAVQARNSGQVQLPVHIFPYRFNDPKHQNLEGLYARHEPLWRGLRQGYDKFEATRTIPEYFFSPEGYYEFW